MAKRMKSAGITESDGDDHFPRRNAESELALN